MSPQIVAITPLINNVLQDQANGKFTISVFLDLKKAFDILDYEALLGKLEHYGVRNTGLNWFKNYLTDRTQCTLVNSSSSNFEKLVTGVPQGSTQGSVLFLLYINDIVKSSTILQFTLFADDTNISYSHANIDSLARTLNDELKLLSEWLVNNKLFP